VVDYQGVFLNQISCCCVESYYRFSPFSMILHFSNFPYFPQFSLEVTTFFLLFGFPAPSSHFFLPILSLFLLLEPFDVRHTASELLTTLLSLFVFCFFNSLGTPPDLARRRTLLCVPQQIRFPSAFQLKSATQVVLNKVPPHL